MRAGRRLVIFLVWLGLASAASAQGGSLAIRLIAANNDGAGVSSGLEDVAGLLQANLPFRRFDLLDQARVGLPADGGASLARGIGVRCNGPIDNLRVTVTRDGRQVINTTLRLGDFRPVILGGFPYERGRLLLLIVVR